MQTWTNSQPFGAPRRRGRRLAAWLALVAVGRLGRLEPAELAQPDAGQDRRDGQERHPEALGDLGAGHPQPAQRLDDLDAIGRRAMRDAMRRRGAIAQPGLALGAVARDPLRARALADFGRLGGLRQRPPVREDTNDHPPALIQAEGRVSVQLHPVSSLGLTGLSTCQPPRGPG